MRRIVRAAGPWEYFVRKVREAGRSLAIEYGVSEHVICKVWTRKNWGWVN